MTPGGAVVFEWSVFDRETGVDSDLGAEPQSAERLIVGGLSTTREQDSMASRRISILSTSALTTLGFPDWKQLTRAPKREWSELTIKNKIVIVLKVIPCNLLKRRQARLM